MTDAPVEDKALIAVKQALRADVRRRRAQRSAQSRRSADTARAERLIDWLDTVGPGCVAAYLSSGTEPSTTAVVEWLTGHDVRVLLPASTEGTWATPAWATYAGADRLRVGPRDILEPGGDRLPAEAVGRAGVVLAPGLAGTPIGDRLGRGGGWYDRVLPCADADATVVLMLSDDEVLDSIPRGPLDRRVHAIVTETRYLDCRSSR